MIKITSLLTAINKAVENAAHAVSQENFKNILSYFETSKGESIDLKKGEDLKPESFKNLQPRMISLQYPKETPGGAEVHNVYVPLLSLAPSSHLEVSEMEVEIDLEVLEKEDELYVGFPYRRSSFLGGEKTVLPKPNAKIKIKIVNQGRTSGVSAIVEGYDKAIKAQIPS